jgi:YidC/Oxa1 family membrane protein insertase
MIDASSDKLTLRWINYLDRLEKNTNFEKFYSTVYFKEVDEDSDYCNCRKDDKEELEGTKIDWVSNANQFFNTALIAENKKFGSGSFETKMPEDGSPDLKKLETVISLPYNHENDYVMDMELYIGPNDFDRLRAMDIGLEQVIPFGRSIFGTINRWIIRPSFDFINRFVPSKGITIIILILIIKILLYPLTYKMLHSQAKMGALKPELAGLKEKFKDDAQKVQMETMKIYREYGVSPLGGCMPMVLQMPIWYALFRFFPASIGFRQEPFLWATDLSSYDVFFHLPFDLMGSSHISLFTILWAVTTLIYTYYNSRHMDMTANPAMKYVQYLMPLMFLVFFNNYASGLTAYMFFSNLINIVQTIGTKRFVFDDERIMGELNKNKEKPKKKGKFQSRLEDAMKQQQAKQATKKKK